MGAKLIYEAGDRVGSCQFIEELPIEGRKYYRGKFKCKCGNVFTAKISAVKRGATISCGCFRLQRTRDVNTIQYENGDKINGLTFVKRVEGPTKMKQAIFICPFCGKDFQSRITSVINGHTKSCGCYKISRLKMEATIHGRSGTQEYASWQHMKARCTNTNHNSYENYGGRGIKICKKWINSFDNFYKDMGDAPSPNHTLDRFPNINGDYKPSNCRWATAKQQARNTRRNIFITYKGEKKTVAEWAEIYGMDYKTLEGRIKISKWQIEEAIERPVKKYKKRSGAKH